MSRASTYREPMLKHVRVARQWHRLMLDCQWVSEHGRARKLRLLRDISVQLAWAHQHDITDAVRNLEASARSLGLPR